MSEKTKPTKNINRNMIICIVCVAVLLIGIIASIVLATQKHFEMEYGDEADYNTHSTMKLLDYDESVLQSAEAHNDNIYTNGTKIVKNQGGQHGIYSLVEDKLVVDTNYIGIVVEEDNDKDTLFKLTHDDGNFEIVDGFGRNSHLTTVEEGKTYAYKMSREIITTAKKDEVRVKISDEFNKEKVEISSVSFKNKFYDDDYDYEIWTITTTNAITYTNLYEVKDGKRELIQTLDLTEGINFTPNSFSFFISSNGTPLIQEGSEVTKIDTNGTPVTIAHKYTLYDINYNKIGELEVDSDIKNKATDVSFVNIGDYTYFQVVSGGTEEDHDFYIADTIPDILYFNLTTYKIDNSRAVMSEINFDYVIENAYFDESDTFEPFKALTSNQSKTATLSVRKIENEQLNPTELVLVNEKLQSKPIDYIRDEVVKLTKYRYLVTDGNKNYFVIDNNYKLISKLGKASEIFTTKDSIIMTANSTTYVCTYDGVIIKKYNSDDVTNIYNERYYLVREIVKDNGVSKERYYLEQCGHREENYIYEKYAGMNTYTYNDQIYVKQITSYTSGEMSVIIRVKEVNSTNYSYEFYNVENKALFTINNVPNLEMSYSVVYHDEDNAIVYCNYNDGSGTIKGGDYFKLDR